MYRYMRGTGYPMATDQEVQINDWHRIFKDINTKGTQGDYVLRL